MEMFQKLAENVKGKGYRIVFPEATDKRVLGAAIRLKADNLVEPILIGKEEEVRAAAEENHWYMGDIQIIDPETYDQFDEMVEAFVERRAGKNTEEQGREMLKDNVYFGTMLVYMDKADGLVCGALYSTGDTVRPALQIIKTRPGVHLTSGAFVMVPPEQDGQSFVFGDCAININPTAEQLAEIAIECAKTAEVFDIDPKVAMLSFSTKGSGASPEVDKVVEATKLAQKLAPQYPIDGELQFDAAYSRIVGAQKAPDSKVAGNATVFVFPEIQSGNLGYKLAQRLGNYQAIGPILQGLNKPISDLSRGCVEDDVYKISIVTANLATMDK